MRSPLLLITSVNFFLPRLGDHSPVDTLIARAGESLDTRTAREQEEAYLKEFGLVEVDPSGKIVRAADGKPVETSLASQFARYLRSETGFAARYAPGAAGCHEALHVTNFIARLIDNELLQHGAIIQNADWYRRARRAQDELAALYQQIGSAHS